MGSAAVARTGTHAGLPAANACLQGRSSASQGGAGARRSICATGQGGKAENRPAHVGLRGCASNPFCRALTAAEAVNPDFRGHGPVAAPCPATMRSVTDRSRTSSPNLHIAQNARSFQWLPGHDPAPGCVARKYCGATCRSGRQNLSEIPGRAPAAANRAGMPRHADVPVNDSGAAARRAGPGCAPGAPPASGSRSGGWPGSAPRAGRDA